MLSHLRKSLLTALSIITALVAAAPALAAPKATISNLRVATYDISGEAVVNVVFDATITDAKDKDIMFVAYFKDKNGNPITGVSPNFRSADGNACAAVVTRSAHYSSTAVDIEKAVYLSSIGPNPTAPVFTTKVVAFCDGKRIGSSENVNFEAAEPEDIYEGPVEASIDNVWTEMATVDGRKVHKVHAVASANGSKGKQLRFVAYFKDAEGRPLKALDKRFASADGMACASTFKTPKSNEDKLENLVMTIDETALGGNNPEPAYSVSVAAFSKGKKLSASAEPTFYDGQTGIIKPNHIPASAEDTLDLDEARRRFDPVIESVKTKIPYHPDVEYKIESPITTCYGCGGHPERLQFGCAICGNTGETANLSYAMFASVAIDLAKGRIAEKKYRKAFEIIMPYVHNREGWACMIMAKCYDYGIGVDRHLETAKWYYKHAKDDDFELKFRESVDFRSTDRDRQQVIDGWAAEYQAFLIRGQAMAETQRQEREGLIITESMREHPEYYDSKGNWSDRNYRRARQQSCTHCHGSGIDPNPSSAMPLVETIAVYNAAGEVCSICHGIHEHWHSRCLSCYVPRY